VCVSDKQSTHQHTTHPLHDKSLVDDRYQRVKHVICIYLCIFVELLHIVIASVSKNVLNYFDDNLKSQL